MTPSIRLQQSLQNAYDQVVEDALSFAPERDIVVAMLALAADHLKWIDTKGGKVPAVSPEIASPLTADFGQTAFGGQVKQRDAMRGLREVFAAGRDKREGR